MAEERSYRWLGPGGEEVEATPREMRERYGLARESVKAMAAGRQRLHRGWRCLDPRRDLQIGEPGANSGCRVVRLHRWRHPRHGEVIATVSGLGKRFSLSNRSLWALARGTNFSHAGWAHEGVAAEWPRGRVVLTDAGGLLVRTSALELWEKAEWKLEEVQALVDGGEVRGLRLRNAATLGVAA